MKSKVLLAIAAASAVFSGLSLESAQAQDTTTYVVKSGETLGGIANRSGTSATAIAKANGLKEPYVVRVGQRLKIPRGTASATPTRSAPVVTPPAATAANISAQKAARTAAKVEQADTSAQASSNPETASQHTVKVGETLGGIASRAKVPRILIAEANGLQAPYNVRVGQTLRIPRTRRHTVANGDTSFSIAMDYGVAWEQIALSNNLPAGAPVKVGQQLLIPTLLSPPSTIATPTAAPPSGVARSPRFAWPITGPIRRGYSTGSNYHDGIDITAAKGAAVRAAAAGTVSFAGHEKDQFGNLVVIDHGNGWFTAYGFLSRVTVKAGAPVAAGERVGLVGDTGRAQGPELHFEVRQDGKPVDPLGELPRAS